MASVVDDVLSVTAVNRDGDTGTIHINGAIIIDTGFTETSVVIKGVTILTDIEAGSKVEVLSIGTGGIVLTASINEGETSIALSTDICGIIEAGAGESRDIGADWGILADTGLEVLIDIRVGGAEGTSISI